MAVVCGGDCIPQVAFGAHDWPLSRRGGSLPGNDVTQQGQSVSLAALVMGGQPVSGRGQYLGVAGALHDNSQPPSYDRTSSGTWLFTIATSNK